MIKPLSQVISETATPDISKLEKALTWLNRTMERPVAWSKFHCTSIAIIFATSLLFLLLGMFCKRKHVNWVLFAVASLLMALEVVKQLYVSYTPASDTWKYDWHHFPFQFCSTPMYVMLFASLCRKGKLYDMATAFISSLWKQVLSRLS